MERYDTIFGLLFGLVGVGGHFAPEWYAVMCISFDLVVAVYLFRKSALFKGAGQN